MGCLIRLAAPNRDGRHAGTSTRSLRRQPAGGARTTAGRIASTRSADQRLKGPKTVGQQLCVVRHDARIPITPRYVGRWAAAGTTPRLNTMSWQVPCRTPGSARMTTAPRIPGVLGSQDVGEPLDIGNPSERGTSQRTLPPAGHRTSRCPSLTRRLLARHTIRVSTTRDAALAPPCAAHRPAEPTATERSACGGTLLG